MAAISKASAPPRAPLSRGRLWLFRLAAVVLAPTLFFLAAELVLRVAGYGYDADFFRQLDIGGQSFLVQSEDFSRSFFPPETMRQPNALRMYARKPAGVTRIFVLGESAAMGDPEPAFGPARYLEALLQLKHPGRRFEIVNVAFTAINSHVLLPLAQECARHEGDLWIVYMGNNEMVGPYGAATILGTQAPARPIVRLVTIVQRTQTGQLAMALVRKLQKPKNQAGSWGGMAMFQQQRVAPESPKREVVHRNFAANLDAMLDCGLKPGAGIILNTMAVNLRESPPFASLHRESLPETVRTNFQRLLEKGIELQSSRDWSNAAPAFAQALELDGQFAEAHFRLAQCLEKTGQLDAARKHFQLACDTDALPFRTDSRLNELIRAAAARRTGARLLLVDAPAAMTRDVPAGLCGQESFYEHVHFNFDGGYRLGLTWADAVERMLDTNAAPPVAWPSQAECERRLGLTDWNRKLVFQSVLDRYNAPPLNSQLNHAERARRLGSYERRLLATATMATVTNAYAVYAESLAAHPDDHHLIEAYAVFLQSLGDRTAAVREWQKVGALLPHDFLPWFELGSLHAKLGNYSESETFLRRAIAVRPALVEGWNELGQCLGAQQKWQPALEAFDRALVLRASEPSLWAFRAKVLASLGRRAEAIEGYRKAVEINPAFWEAHAALGDQLVTAGQIPEAIAAYAAAIKVNPGYAVAHLNLGLMYLRQQRPAEAANEFAETLRLEPSNAVAQEYLAKTRAKMAGPAPKP